MTDYGSFFKSYDIRGTVPELTAELYYWSGYGLVETILKPESLPLEVNIIHDARYSSPEFYAALCKGITEAGGTTVNLGIGSTDMAYAAGQYNGNPSISLTASHNPKDDNGMKVLKEGSTMLGLSEGLAKVRDFVVPKMGSKELNLESLPYPTEDSDTKAKVIESFLATITRIGEIEKVDKILEDRNQKLKIPVDTGNGSAGFVMDLIKDKYQNIEFVPMHWDLDINFRITHLIRRILPTWLTCKPKSKKGQILVALLMVTQTEYFL